MCVWPFVYRIHKKNTSWRTEQHNSTSKPLSDIGTARLRAAFHFYTYNTHCTTPHCTAHSYLSAHSNAVSSEQAIQKTKQNKTKQNKTMPTVKELAAAHNAKMNDEHPPDAAGTTNAVAAPSESSKKKKSASAPKKKNSGQEETARCACVVMWLLMLMLMLILMWCGRIRNDSGNVTTFEDCYCLWRIFFGVRWRIEVA